MISFLTKKNNLGILTIENYYYFIFAVYFASMFYNGLRVGYIAAFLMLCLAVINRFQYPTFWTNFSYDFLIPVLYIFWCGFSVAWFGYSGVGYESYAQAVANSLVPMLFIFVHSADYDKFWQRMLIAYVLAGIIGTYLLFFQPSWYQYFCLLRGFDYRRLSFAYGSIIMGNMGAVAVLVALRMIIRSNGRKGFFLYLLACLFSFLSMQRSAWIVVALTLVFAHYFFFWKLKMVGLRFLAFEIIGLVVVFIVLQDQIMSITNSWVDVHELHYRGSITVQSTISERSYQWERGMASSNLITGSGFGSRGHKAAASGFANYVADGNWVLILCESGIIGLVMFAYISVNALRKGFLNFRALFLPVGVVLTFMFQSIGSNVLEQQLIAPLFWLSIRQLLIYDPNQEMKYVR